MSLSDLSLLSLQVGDNVDGHRAPVFELLSMQTRSVDTQTPSHIAATESSNMLPIMLEERRDGRDSHHSSDDSPFGSSRDEDDEEEERSRSASPSYIPGRLGFVLVSLTSAHYSYSYALPLCPSSLRTTGTGSLYG